MEKVLITLDELTQMGIGGRTFIYSLIKQNKFPKPLKYGRHNRWSLSAVNAWIREQQERSEQEEEQTEL